MTNENLTPSSEKRIFPGDLEAAATCCSAEQQANCCEPGEKSGCCGAERTAGGGCGCR